MIGKTIKSLAVVASAILVGTFTTMNGMTAESQADDLVSKLKDSKISLADGIKQAEKSNGFAISAKFELENGKLSLSVYTARKGRHADAEHNELIELSGDPTKGPWKPEIEVFKDKDHLTRSAMHLTVMQLTRMSLADVVTKAGAQQHGTVYSAIPAVKDGKPVVETMVATPNGKSVHVTIKL